MNTVLRVCVAVDPRQAAHRTADGHGTVGTPHNVFALLPEPSFLGAAGQLIPNHYASPNPARPLQGVGNAGVLPPVNEQADRGPRLAGFPGVGEPLGHPSRPASLIPVVPVEIRQSVFRVHAAVFLACGPVLLRWLPAAGSVGRVGNEGVKRLRLKGFDHLQSVSVNNRPFFSAAVFHR